MTDKKRLYKSTTDKKISGVCGGVAEYFDTDPTIVRLIYATGTVFSGIFPGVFLYIIAALVIPKQSETPSSS